MAERALNEEQSALVVRGYFEDGRTMDELAAEFDVSRKAVTTALEASGLRLSYEPDAAKARVARKSYRALDAALDAEQADPLKKGELAVKVLKGVGQFSADTNLNVRMESIYAALPEEWRGRYLPNEAAIDVESVPVLEERAEEAREVALKYVGRKERRARKPVKQAGRPYVEAE